jgi:aryl-alcohol dehydrogenase-like predicted oxidoreductase
LPYGWAMITIPQTTLIVHPLCLGGNVFGWTANQTQSFDILNAYSMHGGNFIDTADVYSEWKEGNEGGESEVIIGNWMKKHGKRDSMIVATKPAMTPCVGYRPITLISTTPTKMTKTHNLVKHWKLSQN